MLFLLFYKYNCEIISRYAAQRNVEKYMLIALMVTYVPNCVRNVAEFALRWIGACWSVDMKRR